MSVKRSDARAILSKMPMFKGRRFQLISIYNKHNEEKCFLAVSDSRSYRCASRPLQADTPLKESTKPFGASISRASVGRP